MLDVLGEIDQHDAVLLDDADQQDDADDRDYAEIVMNRHQQQQRTEPGRGQSRDDRDRVNQALVQHTENDVDDEQRGGNEDRRARQRVAEGLGVALKTGLKRERLAEIFLDLLDGAYGLADRGARQQV